MKAARAKATPAVHETKKVIWGFFGLCVLLVGCALFKPQHPDYAAPTLVTASYYGGTDGFDGRQTANGEVFDSKDLTAAHRWLPFGTILRLTNPENGRVCLVRINDRGPYIFGRDIDLSLQTARELGIVREGVVQLIAVKE